MEDILATSACVKSGTTVWLDGTVSGDEVAD